MPLRADSAHGVGEALTTEREAPDASQTPECCKQQSSTAPSAVALPLPDKSNSYRMPSETPAMIMTRKPGRPLS
jgi:hypothetical protein